MLKGSLSAQGNLKVLNVWSQSEDLKESDTMKSIEFTDFELNLLWEIVDTSIRKEQGRANYFKGQGNHESMADILVSDHERRKGVLKEILAKIGDPPDVPGGKMPLHRPRKK